MLAFNSLLSLTLIWWIEVVNLNFFFFFLVCGICDQRRARMVVNGLGGVAGFSVGLGMKNSCGAVGYIRITEASLQIS